MKHFRILFAVALVVLMIGVLAGRSNSAEMNAIVLEFKTMVGVDGPFLGNANPINGVPGGGRPWVLDEGSGKLHADGDLFAYA